MVIPLETFIRLCNIIRRKNQGAQRYKCINMPGKTPACLTCILICKGGREGRRKRETQKEQQQERAYKFIFG